MKLFQIDYKRLVTLLLPVFLRKASLEAILGAITGEVSGLHAKFMVNRDVNLGRVKRNGQVCHLRGLLNDELDPSGRRISIMDIEVEGDWVFAMSESETDQLLVDTTGVITYDEMVIISNTAFFQVFVPWGGHENPNAIILLRDYLNQYKLLSKKYIIKHGLPEFSN